MHALGLIGWFTGYLINRFLAERQLEQELRLGIEKRTTIEAHPLVWLLSGCPNRRKLLVKDGLGLQLGSLAYEIAIIFGSLTTASPTNIFKTGLVFMMLAIFVFAIWYQWVRK